jgi:hypothetical protein
MGAILVGEAKTQPEAAETASWCFRSITRVRIVEEVWA